MNDFVICAYCGFVAADDDDLRPYGENGVRICYECGMKPQNYATTQERLNLAFDRAKSEGMGIVVLGGGPPRPYLGDKDPVMTKPR